MKLRLLPGLFLLRRLAGELRGIREQMQAQTVLLTRLVDHVAPQAPVYPPEQVAAESGVDYVDPLDQVLVQDYIRRVEATTGHHPTDDEILSYLSDEKTVSLHQRLLERDREIERVTRERHR